MSSPFVFMEHRVLIMGLHKMYFTNVFPIYWELKYHIELRCVHNVFSWKISKASSAVIWITKNYRDVVEIPARKLYG